MSRLKSNSLSTAAESIRMLIIESEALALESIDKSIDAGRLLVLAKEECGHGQWLPFLERAEVPERKAQRLMQLARSGLKSDTVSDLGGLKAALEFLAQRRLPGLGQSLTVTCHSDEGNPFRSELAAFVWPSDRHAGHFFVAGFRAKADGGHSVLYTKRAIAGDDILCSDGRFMNPVWSLVERNMLVPPANWHFFREEGDGAAVIIEGILSVDGDQCVRVSDLTA